MKSTRIIAIALLLSLILSLCSCIEINPGHTGGDPHGNQNDNHGDNTESEDDGGEGDEAEDEVIEGAEGKVTYVYSVVSKTLHLPGCYHTERMNPDYVKPYTGDINVLLNEGYTICEDCLVPDDEKKEDKEEEKEDEILIPKEEATYATNKKSLVIHHLDCYMIDAMIPENLRYTNLSYEELLEMKYRPCGTCMEEEYKQYKKDHPELFDKD